MVIQDSDSPILKSSAETRTTKSRVKRDMESVIPLLASPLDRFASAVIDYMICLMPLIYLVLSPFQRAIKEAALFENEWQMTIAIALGSLAVVILILFYQTIMLGLWGATLGQWLMGLRVQSLWSGGRLTYMQALHRAVFWLLSCVLMGVPFLAVFSNYMRRALPDRISDTVVISVRAERSVLNPTRQESALVMGIYWAVGIVLALMIASSLLSGLSAWEDQSRLISQLEEEEVLCSAVGDAQMQWSDHAGQEVERLPVAMALYASGVVDQKCLEGEVEQLFLSYEEGPLLYLAKAFVFADRPELSDMYLAKVCELNSDSDDCRLSRVVQAVAEEDWTLAQGAMAELSDEMPPHAAIWAVRQLLQRDQFQDVERYIKAIPDISALVDFTAPARTKWLWGLNKKSEALGVESLAYSTMSDWAKLELAGFMCFEQAWNDCTQITSRSCQQFKKLTGSVDGSLSDSVTLSLTHLRQWECENPGQKKYETLISQSLHEDVKALIVALDNTDTDGFSELMEDPSQDRTFRQEITRRMVERTRSRGLVKILAEEWLKEAPTLSWQKVGETLFRRLYEYEEYAIGLQVAEKMLAPDRAPEKSGWQRVILTAFKSGQVDRAREFLEKYAQIFPIVVDKADVSTAVRVPASRDATATKSLSLPEEFQNVVRDLRAPGGP